MIWFDLTMAAVQAGMRVDHPDHYSAACVRCRTGKSWNLCNRRGFRSPNPDWDIFGEARR